MKLNTFELLKDVKKFQEHMGVIQSKMKDVVVTGSAGGGMVEVDMNGQMEVTGVRIEKSLIKEDGAEMLQDLLQMAFNNSSEKIRGAVSSELGGLVSNIQGAFKET